MASLVLGLIYYSLLRRHRSDCEREPDYSVRTLKRLCIDRTNTAFMVSSSHIMNMQYICLPCYSLFSSV